MVYRPAELAEEFSRSELPEQFVLSRRQELEPEGWSVLVQGEWRLAHHASLPIHRLLAGDRVVGWILGYPIDEAGRLIERDLIAPAADPSHADWESWLYRLGGRFLAIAIATENPRVYIDPVGSIAAVYCPTLGAVASTTSMLPYHPQTADRVELIEAMGIPDSNAIYPVGLTPRLGIFRLLPNHYLDLDRWRAVRHWPNTAFSLDGNPDAACQEIARIVTRQIGALAARFRLQVALTAGQDSRMLLACTRAHLASASFFTILAEERPARLDAYIASRLSRRHGLTFRALPHREPDRSELRNWLYRIGCEVGERRGWEFCATRKQLDATQLEVVGLIGELGRGFYWQEEDTPESELSVDRLLRHVRAPMVPETVDAVERWLSGLPPCDALTTLDLYYLEQRVGCWGSVISWGDAGTAASRIFPLNHRDVIAAMLNLPYDYRRGGRLLLDIIEHTWPELLAFPINRAMGALRIRFLLEDAGEFIGKLAHAVRDPRWALSRLKAIVQRGTPRS